MISFVTLFLGLVLGTKPVEVAAGPSVASVELLLDGRVAASLAGPPWRADVDFGSSLAPHFLVAVARGADGREVARVLQRLNVHHPMAEASLVLLPGTGGTGRTARLTWTSAGHEPPHRVRVTMDGQVLQAPNPAAIELPPFRPEDAHFLRAELDFPDVYGATAELVFGGRRSDSAEAELTAVPATFRGEPPKPEQMDGWFLAGGRDARVVAVDTSPGDIVVVRDETAVGALARLPVYLTRDHSLAKGQRLWFAWPVTRHPGHVAPGYEVFLRSPDLSYERSLSTIFDSAETPDPAAPPRFADAVAMAAISAAAANNPRAVVLVLGQTPDASALTPETVRGFLASLNVPLFVWTLPGADAARARRWGAPVAFTRRGDFVGAARALTKAVAAQKVVWLEGAHLPQAIRVGPKARGVTIAR